MADLFDRLFPTSIDTHNIPVHYFTAAITDYIAGETTRSQIIGAWNLDADAQADLATLCDKIDTLSTVMDKVVFAAEFDAVMTLAEARLKYNTKSTFTTRLGL